MDLTGKVKAKGHVQIWDANTGALLRDVYNVVTCGGSAFMAAYLSGGSPTDMGWLGVGASATAAVTGDTILVSEISDGDRHVAAISAPGSTSVKFSGSWLAGHHTGSWQEIGIFNHVTTGSGTLFSRATYGLLTKGAGDAFILEYTISFADDGI